MTSTKQQPVSIRPQGSGVHGAGGSACCLVNARGNNGTKKQQKKPRFFLKLSKLACWSARIVAWRPKSSGLVSIFCCGPDRTETPGQEKEDGLSEKQGFPPVERTSLARASKFINIWVGGGRARAAAAAVTASSSPISFHVEVRSNAGSPLPHIRIQQCWCAGI